MTDGAPRSSSRIVIAAAVVLAIVAIIAIVFIVTRLRKEETCATGFTREGFRCCIGTCAPTHVASLCPPPFIVGKKGCDLSADPITVAIPAMKITIGPSDWEAEGRVAPMTITTNAFYIDKYEVTVGRFCDARSDSSLVPFCAKSDEARAAFGVALADARAFCTRFAAHEDVGVGRLPTENEWLAAAAGTPGTDRPRRYPWGDTGAVCRRAAFALVDGPCGTGADGPDTVGAHPDGASPLGVHDLAGNVEEWVEAADGKAVVRGGSWKTNLATELRTWLRREVPAVATAAALSTIGFRCAYSLNKPNGDEQDAAPRVDP